MAAGDAAVGLSQKYAAVTAIPGVVAFWDFAEPRAPFYSKAGRGLFPLRQGAGSRATKTANGPLGNALSFNGTSDYLILDAGAVGDLNIGARSINQCCVLAFVARSNSTSSSSGADWSLAETKTVSFAKTAALWRDLTFVAGVSLAAAVAARSVDLPSGTINGFGIYSPGNPAGNVRVRNFELLTF